MLDPRSPQIRAWFGNDVVLTRVAYTYIDNEIIFVPGTTKMFSGTTTVSDIGLSHAWCGNGLTY